MKKPKLNSAERYRRNCMIDMTVSDLKRKYITPIFGVGFEFMITPVSKICLPILKDYIAKLAEANEKSLDPNEGLNAYRMWYQKRKFKRLFPNEKIPIEVIINDEKHELINISQGGFRIKTTKYFKYGDNTIVTLRFPKHELNFSTRIANVTVEGEWDENYDSG